VLCDFAGKNGSLAAASSLSWLDLSLAGNNGNFSFLYSSSFNQKLSGLPCLVRNFLPGQILSLKPSQKLSSKPSQKPFSKPSQKPSSKPRPKPSTKPSIKPSSKPSQKPSAKLSQKPSSKPSWKPPAKPSQYPSAKPHQKPSAERSQKQSAKPSHGHILSLVRNCQLIQVRNHLLSSDNGHSSSLAIPSAEHSIKPSLKPYNSRQETCTKPS
jgi:hypothetical protein